MNEFELIRMLSRGLATNEAVVVGAGDDCAVLDLGGDDRLLLFKTDAVVEGVHFTGEAKPEQIGHKALGRSLSDVAAMGGAATAAVVTLGLQRDFDPEYVHSIYKGMNALAGRYGVAIVGGETTASPERMFISVAVLGSVARGRCVLRSGAKAGDALFVTGELGGSLAGKHLDFEPRLQEGAWLAANYPVHAMIDLSDGLAGDLRHVLEASGVGAELLASAIPISRAARQRERAGGGTPMAAALTDGEDFELLFTLPAKTAVPLVDDWKRQFPGLRLSCIGKITAERGLRIRDRKGIQPYTGHGYVHFQES